MSNFDTVEQLDTIAERIRHLRTVDGLSWREIAAREEFSGVSHSTLRDIANGENPSAETCRKLGIRKSKVYTLAFRFRDRDEFERVRAAVDEHEEGRTAWLLEQVGE